MCLHISLYIWYSRAKRKHKAMLGHARIETDTRERPRVPWVGSRVHPHPYPHEEAGGFHSSAPVQLRPPFRFVVSESVWNWHATLTPWDPFRAEGNLRTPTATTLNLIGRREEQSNIISQTKGTILGGSPPNPKSSGLQAIYEQNASWLLHTCLRFCQT